LCESRSERDDFCIYNGLPAASVARVIFATQDPTLGSSRVLAFAGHAVAAGSCGRPRVTIDVEPRKERAHARQTIGGAACPARLCPRAGIESSLSRCRSEGIRGLGSGCQSFAVSELHAVFFGLERTQRLFALDTMDPSRAPIVRCGIRRVRQITPWNFCVPQRFG
jgi:hypothetical protein